MGHNSRYTIRDLTLDTNNNTTSSGTVSGEKKNHNPQDVSVKAGELDGNENSYIYGGTDANLVRKLTLLDQERKLFDLVDHSAIATVKENVDEVGVVNPDIYIDPRVILAPKMLESMPSNTCSTPTGIVEVDIQRLNQTNYFANTCSDTIANLAIDDAAPAEYTNKTSLVKPICKRNNAILNPILSKPLLVIIRHGKTEHNKLGLFTGDLFVCVPLCFYVCVYFVIICLGNEKDMKFVDDHVAMRVACCLFFFSLQNPCALVVYFTHEHMCMSTLQPIITLFITK